MTTIKPQRPLNESILPVSSSQASDLSDTITVEDFLSQQFEEIIKVFARQQTTHNSFNNTMIDRDNLFLTLL